MAKVITKNMIHIAKTLCLPTDSIEVRDSSLTIIDDIYSYSNHLQDWTYLVGNIDIKIDEVNRRHLAYEGAPIGKSKVSLVV